MSVFLRLSRPLTNGQLYLFKLVAGKNTSVLKELLTSCSYLWSPRLGATTLSLTTPPVLCLSPMPQEPDSEDEWQHLLETTEPVPIQLKTPLTLLCNPDFCQRIQSQLHEAGGQVMGRRVLWRGLGTVFTDETLKNIGWHKEVCPFPILFQSTFNSRRFANLL